MNDCTVQTRAGFREFARGRVVVALCILVFGVAAILGSAAFWRGMSGVRWALLAVAICGVAGLLSLVVSRFARGAQAALWVMLVGMGIRMTAALTACLIVNANWREGIDAGFGWYLVGAYLITLALDILFLTNSHQVRSIAGQSMPFVSSGISRGVLWTEGERHG